MANIFPLVAKAVYEECQEMVVHIWSVPTMVVKKLDGVEFCLFVLFDLLLSVYCVCCQLSLALVSSLLYSSCLWRDLL